MQLRRLTTAIALIAALGVLAGCGSSAKSAAPDAGGGLILPGATGASGPVASTVNVTLGDTNGLAGPMSIVTSPSTVPAGDVTFVVKNTGTIEHEAVVLKTNIPYNKTPHQQRRRPTRPRHHRRQQSQRRHQHRRNRRPQPQTRRHPHLHHQNMTAGNYAVVCNIAQHYGKGMRAPSPSPTPPRR